MFARSFTHIPDVNLRALDRLPTPAMVAMAVVGGRYLQGNLRLDRRNVAQAAEPIKAKDRLLEGSTHRNSSTAPI